MARSGSWELVGGGSGNGRNYSQSPYQYVLNNPIRYVDLFGLWETTATGYSTSDKEDIRRYTSYLNFESQALNNTPSSSEMASFVRGEMSGTGLGTLSNAGRLVFEVQEKGYRNSAGIDWYANKESVDNA